MAERDDIFLGTVETSLYQDSDSCEDVERGQELRLKSMDAGGGNYFVIETTRWAFNSIEEFMKQLKAFETAVRTMENEFE